MTSLTLIGVGGVAPSAPGSPVAGFIAQWDASNAGSITDAGGGAVSQWNDLSGNGYHLVQGTGSRQPTTGTRTQNSLNVIDFDGSGDQMLTTSAVTQAQPITIFVVALSDVTSGGSLHVIGSRSPSSLIVFKNGSQQYAVNAGSSVAGGTIDTNAHVWSIVANNTSSQVWLDGSSVASGTAGTTGWNAQTIPIGGSDTFSNLWNGWIGEILIYGSGLGTTDRQSNEAYLKAKWGTP